MVLSVAADPLEVQQVALETPSPTPVIDEAPRSDLVLEHPLIDASSVSAWLPIGPQHPYPLVVNPQVQHFLDRFTGERRDVIGLWINRSGRYLGMMREILKSRGMPEELAFTAMIESGFNPVAVSRAGAVGLWQFMAATGRRYGLRVDQWVDERRDPEKSTFAAASYLRDLHRQFGSWWLAQAAYNAGEMRVAKAIKGTGSDDFWVLSKSRYLVRETKEFVPQIQAATMIGRDPAQYGFQTADTTTMTAFEIVTVPAGTPLKWLAAESQVPVETLTALNAPLIRGVTPPGQPYALKVPLGKGTTVQTVLESPRREVVATTPSPRVKRAAAKTPKRESGVQRAARRSDDVHVVRPRDTVSSIAREYGVSVNEVLQWNSLKERSRIRPGDRIKVTGVR